MINKIYIVNLERCQDKKKHMQQQMDKFISLYGNINYKFFKAIDGKNDSRLSQYKFNIPNWHDPNTGLAITKGEVGCSLSHYSIWKKIVDQVENGKLSNDCQILILEDDVIFLDNFMTKFTEYKNEIKSDYDMLYLHRKPLDFENEIKLSPHINKPNKSYWACAYILTYSGAKKLMESKYLDNLIPVDEYLPIMYGCNIMGYEKLYEKYEKLKCFAVCPNLLKLNGNAFEFSETFHSDPYISLDNYEYEDVDNNKKNFVLLYIGEDKTPSFDRFMSYCKVYAVPIKTLSHDGSDYHKLIEELNTWSNDKLVNTLILVTSTNNMCNILPVVSPMDMINKYHTIVSGKSDVVVNKKINDLNFLFGWALDIKNILKQHVCETINKSILAFHQKSGEKVILDDENFIFYAIDNNPKLVFNHYKSKVINPLTNMTPCFFIPINKEANIILNRIENYTGNNWNIYYGYRNLVIQNDKPLPKIYFSIKLGNNLNVTKILEILDYPKELLLIKLNSFRSTEIPHILKYNNESEMFEHDKNLFLQSNCDYYFYTDDNSILFNPTVLKELLNLDKLVVAPLIKKEGKAWSNFWGDIDQAGFYVRSFDYFDIINGVKKGCWNVPYITNVFLIKRQVFDLVPNLFTDNIKMDVDMRICHNLREKNIFMYVSNLSNYGVLMDPITTEPTFVAPLSTTNEVTLYDIKEKRDLWEKKYLHESYYKNKGNLQKIDSIELCDGIYNFPLFSEIFCDELIKLTESYGKWSKGKNEHNDPRLGKNYYENVPTVDIQLFEIKLDKVWVDIVFSYIAPMAKHLYNDYKTKDINIAFVVKYTHQDQSSLSAHHDASTYTVNIALNKGNGIDYDGGGCRFIRQNYVLKNQEPGMCCIHPGRLTAYHEGLAVTMGTRYILVSFIN